MISQIPEVDKYLNYIISNIDDLETKINLISSSLNTVGSNANIFLDSVYNTSNVTGMYNYLKASSNNLIHYPPEASS